MYYNAKILRFEPFDPYQGSIYLQIAKRNLQVAYCAQEDRICQFLKAGADITVDLWLLDGYARRSFTETMLFQKDDSRCWGLFSGRVIEIFNFREFRLNCGEFTVDVLNRSDIDFRAGDFIETESTYQVFFPGTEYAKEACWG